MAEADPGTFAAAPVPELTLPGPDELDRHLGLSRTPFVVRGVVSEWPLVQAGRKSDREARDYLLGKHREAQFMVSIGERGSGGRLFYNADMGMNFRTVRARLPAIFAQLDALEDDTDPPPVYLASIDVHTHFNGLHEANHVPLGDRDCVASIWMGTRTRIAAHNDFPDNLACVAVGRRRFTLFPPDQFRNLYLGPIDNTPAGRAVSMVDLAAPDFALHPRFQEALRHAQVAELGPGDAIYIPSMWYHHVEGLERFNVLVNYWWRQTPHWMGQPQDALNHALLSIRDLPEDEKSHWRDMFDYYVFGDPDEPAAHIPEEARSALAPMTPETASRIRSFILRQLNR
jgi:hypothetical protein